MSTKNTFKTFSTTLTDIEQDVYNAPFETGDVGIVLLAQAANISGVNASVTMKLGSNPLVKDVVVPAEAALGLLDGKLVLQNGQALKAYSNAEESIQLTISVLEITKEMPL